MRVYFDDIRQPPLFDSLTGDPIKWDAVVRTADEILTLVRSGVVTFISFDHDLGTDLTGYDVAKEIEQLASEDLISPINYTIHSANPVGANNIDAAMKKAGCFWES